MKIKIYDGERTVDVKENLVKAYDKIRPFTSEEIEGQLRIVGIKKSDALSMTDENLNKTVEDIMREEIDVSLALSGKEMKSELEKLAGQSV